MLAKDLNSTLLKFVQMEVQTVVDKNNGRLPNDDEWNQLIEELKLRDEQNSILRKVNNINSAKLFPVGGTTEVKDAAKLIHLEIMQYESQIATFLLAHAERKAGLIPGSSLFSVGDFIDLPAFVAKLRTEDPVSKFLWNQFSPQTQEVLKSATSTPEEQKLALVQALDNILKGVLIFEPVRFAGVALSQKTKDLKLQNPIGKDLIRLNRLLLEDAYPLQIAKSLLPSDLNNLFFVKQAASLSDILQYTDDPLANIDPNDKESGALSPVGFIHLFRQYFFDLGTFLGEPVEHVWLAPGTTIELIEVSTRKTIVERSEESAQEVTSRTEQSTAVKDEISDAVKAENGSSTKLGVSTTHSVDYKVYEGSATASFGAESTRKESREQNHKESREQTEKLSTEIKRSFKSVFKTVTETTDTRSRRYVLQNPGGKLINYELRRKMRRVGVQMQDVGKRLCWQVFIDDAGATLGLAELVHFAESPDLANLKQPEIGPPPAPIKITVSARFLS